MGVRVGVKVVGAQMSAVQSSSPGLGEKTSRVHIREKSLCLPKDKFILSLKPLITMTYIRGLQIHFAQGPQKAGHCTVLSLY